MNGVAVITLKSNGKYFASSSQVMAGQFNVTIRQLVLGPPPPDGGCCQLLMQPADVDFMYVVFARH